VTLIRKPQARLATLSHADSLVGPTLPANTAVGVRGIGAVLEVIPTSCG
jgi:hypothetical protein